MSLNISQLKADLKAAWQGTITGNSDPEVALDNFIDSMATAIDSYVKGATVKYTGNLQAAANPVTAVSPTTTIANLE